MFRSLQKWHGAGNDFLIDVTGPISTWTGELARAACDRHRGVGADGLIVLESRGDRYAMVLFNADGSRAEMSGNGARCAAAAVSRSHGASGPSVQLETDAGVRTVSLHLDGHVGQGEVQMGEVTFGDALDGTLAVAYVGNPHVVVRDDPTWSVRDREDLAKGWSEVVGGANVEFATVISPQRVEITVIERGVGWTLACGTGSVATAAVLHRHGDVEERVVVGNPGGDLVVTLGAVATLAGPMIFAADVEWPAS